MIHNRLLLLGSVFLVMFSVVLLRFYRLQILEGESYREEFLGRITRSQTSPASRGTIYDRNGIPLAYDELTYAVTIEDNGSYTTRTERNQSLNRIIYETIDIIEKQGGELIVSLPIEYGADNRLIYTAEGTARMRFLADIYGHADIADLGYHERLGYNEREATPEQALAYLRGEVMYGIGAEYEPYRALQITAVRYAMSGNSYQRYRATTLAAQVNEEIVTGILENQGELQGVAIVSSTLRKYEDSEYFAQILGYTGPVSEAELAGFREQGLEYEADAQVGKAGLEQALEEQLRGRNGNETFYVDNVGRITQVLDVSETDVGKDVWLTIDSELQKTIYHLLEQKLAGILLANLVPQKDENTNDLAIDANDVLIALFDNQILDIRRFSSAEAGEAEQRLFQAYGMKKEGQLRSLEQVFELPASELPEELRQLASYIPEMMESQGYMNSSAGSDSAEWWEWRQRWQQGEISLGEYLLQGIQEQWVEGEPGEVRYTSLDEAWESLRELIVRILEEDSEYERMLYSMMVTQGEISRADVCLALLEQGVLQEDGSYERLASGQTGAYAFLREQIENLRITPAQLALDPCTASSVVVDPDSGEVLACVTYPGYDNNRLANRVDGEYYNRLLSDRSLPLYNNATQQRTAPGSTFKPVTAAAALTEGLITPETMIEDHGIFDQITPSPRCWIHPGGTHGQITVAEALRDSCNYFFYSLGYGFSLPGMENLSGEGDETRGTAVYQPEQGIRVLQDYMEMFGFGENTGIEIGENAPQMADEFPVTAAIGQSNHNYTTTQLARYTAALANHGVRYDLTLVQRIEEQEEAPASGRNLDVISPDTWEIIGAGMNQMAASNRTLSQLPINLAGKTGTAQQNRNRPNHALFIGYAPYEEPEIAVATRIAYGYSSSNAVEVTADILRYYFGLEPVESLVTGQADIAANNGNIIID